MTVREDGDLCASAGPSHGGMAFAVDEDTDRRRVASNRRDRFSSSNHKEAAMTSAHRGFLGRVAVGAAVLALLCGTAGNAAAGGKIRVKAGLTPTGVDPDAQGQAGLGVRGTAGMFDVKASRLDRRAGYDIVVKGVKVGTLRTNGGGSGHLRFRTNPTSRDLVLGFDPRGVQLSVRNAGGHDVLVGTMPAATIDPTATACCIPDGNGGSSCQELTSDACTTAGGAAQQAATCIPDPCAATPPPAATVCCTNETGDDESESECEDHNAADCVAAGGMVVEASSCDPNPCAPVPPPTGDAVACCVTHEGENECEVITTEACTASGGTAMTGATCEPDPCASTSGSGDGDDDNGGSTTGGNDGNGGDGGGDGGNGGSGDHGGGDD
jgi:hypothetical protein